MKKVTAILIAVFALATFANAQLTVVANTPNNFATGVALTTTVSFTFSAPLDTTIRYESGYPIGISGPDDDSLQVTGGAISGDLRTVTITVNHRPSTDYVWMITGARSQSGEDLLTPFLLNYTTAAAYGSRSVAGSISFAMGNTNRAVVGLLTRPVFEDNGRLLVATNVVGLNSYTIANVRTGVFWPVCAIDFNNDGEIDPELGDPIGFYDPNNDGVPDSIVVSQSNLTGIDMTLTVMRPLLARDRLPAVQNIATQFAADAALKVINAGDNTNPDGTCDTWMYMYYSAQRVRNFIVFASPQMIAIDTVDFPEFPTNMLPIPANFIDSDSALAIAELNGGLTFRTQHTDATIDVIGGNMFWVMPNDPTRIFWVVNYETPEQDESLTILIDIVTGQVIPMTDVSEARVESPSTYRVLSNYPNPFNAETTIRYRVPVTGNITVAVFDAMGRQIKTLVQGMRSAGEYNVQFNGKDLSSGMYIVRMNAGKDVYQSKLLLVK